MSTTISIRVKRDTAANWASVNPVLAAGQPGYDTTNAILKIGDGTTAWSSLPQVSAVASLPDADYGDITVSGTGTALTVDAGAITLAKMADIATARIIGRSTAGTGVPEALTGTQATALLDTVTSGAKGLAPASGGGTSNFLRADATWAAPTASVADGDKGDITVSSSGSVWTIDSTAVTFAKMQNITTARLLGRTTAGSGVIEELSTAGSLSLTGGVLSGIKGCKVYRTADKTISNNTHTVIDWDEEAFDDGSCHDNSTNNSRLSPPNGATRVRLSAYAVYTSNDADSLRLLGIYKNFGGGAFDGTKIVRQIVIPGLNTDQHPIEVSTGWLPHTNGDYYEVNIFQLSGGNLTLKNTAGTSYGRSSFELEWY